MEFVREIPSECLSLGEASGVWSGWSNHGDREIVREAAAKGTHIELAHKCLAYRRRCIVAEAKKYFADELEIWIDEMLEKGQIHRASHILRNAGKNPLEFIRDRCVKCREPKLRRYLADYVLAQEGFQAKHEEAWNVIKDVARLEEKHGSEESLMGDCSIEEISQLPDDVRSSLVADLHFNMGVSCFSDKLNGVVLWDYLLANNKIDRMVFWIGAHCQEVADPADVHEVATDGEISLTSRALQRLAIDEDIVELVATSGATYPVKELVLDRLSGYGIFTREERQHARSVLARFFSNRVTPEAFRSILLGFRCTVDPDAFAKQVFSIIYHRGASDCPASFANIMETGSLLELMTKMASRPEVTLLVRAIIKNVEVFHGDLETHIRDDPVLLFTLFFLEPLTGSSRQVTEDAPTFRGTPKNDLNLGLEAIGSETIQHSLEQIPYLAAALEGFPKSNEPTLYDLLNGYEGLDLAMSFKWRDRKDVLLNFRSENLARNFGREEKLSYVHYLRKSRASMAVRALERESEVNVQNKVKPRRDRASCEADVNCTAHEKVKVNESIEAEAELMGSEGFKVNDEVNEIKANDEARRFNNEIEVKSETSKVKVNDEVEGAKVDQVKVHEDFDGVKVNEEVDRFKVHEDLDGRQSMSIDRPLMNKVNEIKLNKDAIKINVMMNAVDKVRKMKISEEVDEVKTKKGMKVHISDEVKDSEETRRSKIIGEFDEVMAKKGMKVKNKVRVQIGGDIKVEMKVEAAAYARALALESGEDEVTCTCVAFIELLGLNSECLRVGTTAWAYVNKCLGISIRDSLRSLSSSSSPRDVGEILRLLERSFEANLTRDRSEDGRKVDFKGAIAVTDRPEVVDTLEANDEVGLKEIPVEDELKVALDGNTQDVLNCGGRPFNLKTVLKDTQSFVDASRTWEMIVGFARIHETSTPRSFLRLLALHDRRLEFVLAGQMFSYPLEAMLESAREFENPHVREHLCLAMRNTRILATRSDHETRKFREFPDETGSEELEDLWTIVLRCHASRDPPGAFLETSRTSRSPVLTVLATFYEPSATSGFCYSWLVVSVGAEKLLREYEIPLREELWSARSVRLLLKSCLDLGYAGTLARAFLIFMPKHPLGRLFRAFLEDANHHEATLTFLRDFVEACANLGCNPGIDWDNTSNEDYLWNLRWIALVAVECSMSFVARCSSSLHLGLVFLELHTRVRFNEELYVTTPNFASLQRVVAILADTPVQLHFDAIQLDDRGSNVDCEIQRCVDKLLDFEDFENALALSKVAGLRCSNIILAQYRSEFKRSTSDLIGSKLEPLFWKRCAGDLRKYEVSFDETAAFFIEYAEKVSSHRERYEILKLALESLEPIGTDKKTLDTVEMAMWKSCVLADPDSIDIETDPRIFNKLKAELLSGIVDLRVSCRLNDATEESAVGVLISRFVTAGQLATALHISAIFTYKHRDLQILMLCMSLAEGEISPYQLTSQQRSLLSETGRVKLQKYSNLRNRGVQRTSPSSTVPKVSPSVNEDSSHFSIEQIQVDTLSMIDRLTKSLESGSATGTRIMLCAKLATYLRRSYQSLLNLEDPMPLLYEVVGSNCDRKLEMVGDIVTTYRIKNESVAKFLAEEIIANTPRLVEESLEDSLVMWGNPLGSNIQAIIELCNDPALLGWELLRAANLSLGNSHGERRNVLTLKVAIELLIRSHDCFTASCSMEGIASILRKAQHLVYTLQHHKHWSLLVRLVTGLGRFTEMNYVFQILKENDQFEFLLGKGLDKIPGLKTALLEFCKRQCPGDKELFTLIALHFTLYTEIAYKWESEAIEIMNEIVAEARKNSLRNATGLQIPLRITRNETVEKQLQVVVENFTHSTEYYLQDNKLNLASRCSHQAQLAALQISLLASVPQNHQAICLINLGPDELNRAICQDLTLPQALALLQAYNHHGDWSSAIYNHLVMNGETRYLKEFMARRSLTAPIVQDCVCRYRSEKTVTRQMTESMQILVSELSDLECKYVLASRLGFKRIIEDMLANPSTGSYLKDTVWKQGFKSTDFYE